jgi:hypothetical protein
MRDLHEDLLGRWSREQHHQGRCFIKDGIIDSDRWRSADIKILFLLKEAYHDGGSTWDLRKHVRENDLRGKPALRNLVCWSYAIHNIKRGHLPGLPSLPQRKSEYHAGLEALRSSAIVNIKKSGGQSSSSAGDIQLYARLDKRCIQRQIKLINPNLVVCGHTWDFVKDWWPKPKPVMLYDGVWQVGQLVFINFWHPAYRDDELIYYALAAMLHFSKVLAK